VNSYSLSHLSDPVLLRYLAALVARDRATTAKLLAHLAEVDARKLYRPAGYPSMYVYCVHELCLSDQAAFKRIRAARTARQFPAIFAALADGRLHLGAVVLLTPFLTPETADELLAAATHKTCSEVEQLLAQHFPGPTSRPRCNRSHRRPCPPLPAMNCPRGQLRDPQDLPSNTPRGVLRPLIRDPSWHRWLRSGSPCSSP
jgi:hypothetical protein